MMQAAKSYRDNNKDVEAAIKDLTSRGHKPLAENIKETVVQCAVSNDKKQASVLILGCATDFVASIANFKTIHTQAVTELADNGTLSETINEEIDKLSQTTKEKISIVKEEVFKAWNCGFFSFYNHHDRKQSVILEYCNNLSDTSLIEELMCSAIIHKESDLEKL